MNQSFELKGYWWLPETPEIKVSGTLSFSPGELVSLELMGSLIKLDNPNPKREDLVNPSIILGTSLEGQSVTIANCTQVQSTGSLIGISTSKFTGYFAYIGVHFSTESQIKFRELSISFYNLDEWFSKDGFTTNSPKRGSEIVSYEQPNPVRTTVGEYHIDFVVFGPNQSMDPFTYVNISQEARINIWSDTEKSIDDFLTLIRHLQNFLTLGMSKPTFLKGVTGFTESAKEKEPSFYYPVKMYYPADGLKPRTVDIPYFQMMFTLPVIENQLQQILETWISKADLIKPVYDLYFSALYNPSVYLEFEFLSLAQAIETYHRQMYGGKYQSDDVYEDGLYKMLVAAIPDDLDKDFRSSLKQGRLKYANEYSLRKRLQLLGAHLAEGIFIAFLQGKEQRDYFANKVANTRNYLTHYPPELKDEAAKSGHELHDLTQKLRLVLQVCLLEELGFTWEKIAETIKRNREYLDYL